MQTYVSRIAWVLILLVLGTSCGGEPRLWVRLAEWPAGAETLHVVPWINGVPQKQNEITVPNGTPGFVITLPTGTVAEIRLQITALDGELCKVGTAEVTEALGPALRLTHEQEVQIEMLDGGPVCTLSLELPSDVSVVRSTPAGLVCPTGSVRCEAEFPKGSAIEVELGFEPHKYSKVSASEASCTEQGTCSISLERSRKSHVEPTKRNCSPDGFCIYNLKDQQGMLFGVWGINADNVWAVGVGGTILNWNGKAWRPSPDSGTQKTLYSVWGSDVNKVWAVGAGGIILNWDGRSTWTPQDSGTTQNLRGIWGRDAKNVWVAGLGGTILKWDGSTWTTQDSGTMGNLYAVWGSDENNVWAVGVSGASCKWDRNTWTQQKTTSAALRAVWGTDVDNLWTVREYGRIFKWEGDDWSPQYIIPEEPNSYGVWTGGSNNVWVVGAGGMILNFDGSGWRNCDSGTKNTELRAVWGSSASDIWVVGASGTILRRKL